MFSKNGTTELVLLGIVISKKIIEIIHFHQSPSFIMSFMYQVHGGMCVQHTYHHGLDTTCCHNTP